MTSDSKQGFRVLNFSAGPAALPLEVLEEVQRDCVNYKGEGLSVMEMSHRSPQYEKIHNDAIADLRELLDIPENYKVIFMQGGATSQFAAVPLNLLSDNSMAADYVITGAWSKKAFAEAKKYGKPNAVCDTSKTDPPSTSVPSIDTWKINPESKYLYLCVNETVHGVTMREFPDSKVPIVADYSSCFMSEPIDVSKFGVIYAGAQKNIGPAGVTVVIVREDLMGNPAKDCPVMFDWKINSDNNSLYNTPPCFAIYVMGLCFKWLKKIGGLKAMKAINEKKAKLVYDVIDASDFYHCPVKKENRSLMNIRFRIPSDPALEKKFLQESEKLNMRNLKGHRSTGGLRASLYNAQPVENCEALAKFMKDFEAANKK